MARPKRGQRAQEPDWPAKHPWDKLPRGGAHPYVPPRSDWIRRPPRGDQDGYLDEADNEWTPHITPAPGDFHWDVQHPNGKHTNIRPDGEVQHGPDNF
jgi:hypothetical protein